MRPFDREAKNKPKPPAWYYEARLFPEHKDALVRVLKGQSIAPSMRRELQLRIEYARRFELPCAEVNWKKYEDEARKRGASLPDLLGDAPWELG